LNKYLALWSYNLLCRLHSKILKVGNLVLDFPNFILLYYYSIV